MGTSGGALTIIHVNARLFPSYREPESGAGKGLVNRNLTLIRSCNLTQPRHLQV